MPRKVVAADVMFRPADEMAGPEHGVEDVAVRWVWRCIE